MNESDVGVKPGSPVRRRYRLLIEGIVQGVGFRPYIHRLASDLGLGGSVSNSSRGVSVDVEGPGDVVDQFIADMTAHLPGLARIDRVRSEPLAPRGLRSFTIADSARTSHATAMIPPDIATCAECLADICDPSNRRYRYPFTNCTNCGPRYSIVQGLPYDRPRTTMARFAVCEDCAAEYADPGDRRFHAQPIACPACGPHIELRSRSGELLAERNEALQAVADALRDGNIVALKGLGGFQLLVDARNEGGVRELRRRKHRPDKPFAVMFPSIESTASDLHVTALARELLVSKEAPIVLLRRRELPMDGPPALCDAVAPRNPDIGAMLPYTPLHHLLMADLRFPIVATSGNLADEPMIVENDEALDRLGSIADLFLTHDRPIASAVDDSVVKIVAGRELTLRRARGYAPWALDMGRTLPPLVAYGGHLKSACAVTTGTHVVVGPHIGDLESARARLAWQRSLDHLVGIHQSGRTVVACDRHPDYFTTRAAMDSGARVVPVQHHVAHIAACMAENELDGPVLGIAWDGTGYGDDGTIWGGEFIQIDGTRARRVAHLRPFRIPGGEVAVKEPRRSAIGVLYETLGQTLPESLAGCSRDELRLFGRMLSNGINSPLTTSAGRLLDAAASLAGIVQRASFEGHATMALEHAIGFSPGDASYEFPVVRRAENQKDASCVVDWVPAIRALLLDIEEKRPVAQIAAAFHNGLINAIVNVSQHIGEPRVVLTGGCFQNRYLTEHTVTGLCAAGFKPYWHRRLPPNDGALAAGQAVWATRLIQQETGPCA